LEVSYTMLVIHERTFVVLECLGLACVSSLHVTRGRISSQQQLHIISHHKSGTFAAMNLLISMCCRSATQTTFFHRDCRRSCSSRGLWFHTNGAFTDMIHDGDTIVHFIRDVDAMLVSGYLYHRNCQEWSNAPLDAFTHMVQQQMHPPDRSSPWYVSHKAFPPGFAGWLNANATTSYCHWLQAHSLTQGLRAELYRTLHADDGIGKMLSDYRDFPTAINVCLSTLPMAYDSVWQALEHFHENLSFLYQFDNRHRTNHSEALALRTVAASLLADVQVPSNFPCHRNDVRPFPGNSFLQ